MIFDQRVETGTPRFIWYAEAAKDEQMVACNPNAAARDFYRMCSLPAVTAAAAAASLLLFGVRQAKLAVRCSVQRSNDGLNFPKNRPR